MLEPVLHALKVGRIADIFEFVGAAFTVPTRDATEMMISKCFIRRGDINCCRKVWPFDVSSSVAL